MTATNNNYRAQAAAKLRARILEFVLSHTGITADDVCAKFHMSGSAIRLHLITLAQTGAIVRFAIPRQGKGGSPFLWLPPGSPLPAIMPVPKVRAKTPGPITGKKQSNGYPKAVEIDAAQLGMVRSDPLMVGLFGPAGA